MSGEIPWSLKNGDLDVIKQHLTLANVNTIVEGRTPLHYAADYGQVEVVRYLLSIGADVNLTDAHGITPLLAAIWEGHTDTVKLLLSSGAKTCLTAPDGTSYAECAEKQEIRNLLVQQNGVA